MAKHAQGHAWQGVRTCEGTQMARRIASHPSVQSGMWVRAALMVSSYAGAHQGARSLARRHAGDLLLAEYESGRAPGGTQSGV